MHCDHALRSLCGWTQRSDSVPWGSEGDHRNAAGLLLECSWKKGEDRHIRQQQEDRCHHTPGEGRVMGWGIP